MPQHTTVLIVGAGPSGLMMAAQLLRNGVQPVIIDQRDGPTDHTKALAVQARTLEIYRQMGVEKKALNEGKIAKGVAFNQHGKVQTSFSFDDIGHDSNTPFPYVFFYPQSSNERLLLDELTRQCCPVYWNTTLTTLQQHSDHVMVQVQNSQSSTSLTCSWIIGADGAHSAVRKLSGTKFNGDVYPQTFYLIDAQFGKNNLNDYGQLVLGERDFAAFFPMPDENNYRILGNIPKVLEGRDDLTTDDVLPYIKKATKWSIDITRTNWFSFYRIHYRVAQNFKTGHCFLIGDAAHIHSPIGGQGMNTGLQDAYNLGWKLAGVINNTLKLNVLDSYEAERLPIAKALVNTTDRIFKLIVTQNSFVRFFSRWILPHVIKLAWSSHRFRQKFFKLISQTDISYRNSKINLHLSLSANIKAGDRLPYIKIFDEKTQEETDLHAWCAKPGFTLIVLGQYKEIDIFTLARWITQKYNGVLNLYYLPPSKKNTRVFEAFEMDSAEKKKALIIRPDMHIGYMNDVVDIDMMDNYLLNVAGLNINQSA